MKKYKRLLVVILSVVMMISIFAVVRYLDFSAIAEETESNDIANTDITETPVVDTDNTETEINNDIGSESETDNNDLAEMNNEDNSSDTDFVENEGGAAKSDAENKPKKNEEGYLSAEIYMSELEGSNEENVSEITLEELKTNGIVSVSGNKITISEGSAAIKAMILLSHCNDISDKDITINTSGAFNLTGEAAEYNGNTYYFNGLGSKDNPFEGTLEAGNAENFYITIDRPLFREVSSNAKLPNITIIWQGNGNNVPVFAYKYVFADTENHEYNFPVKIVRGEGDDIHMGMFIGEVDGVSDLDKLIIDGNKIDYINIYDSQNNIIETLDNTFEMGYPGDAGLICGKLSKGNIVLNNFNFPSEINVTSTAGNAGGLIGEMGPNTGLVISGTNAININEEITSQADSKGAGGIVGKTGDNSSVEINTAMTISGSFTANGADGYAGGFAGNGSNVNLSNSNTSELVLSGCTTKAYNAGGLYGEYTLGAESEAKNESLPDWITISEPKVRMIGQSSSAGGIFGTLNLRGGSTYELCGSEDAYFNFNSTNAENAEKHTNTGMHGLTYGALAGRVKAINVDGVENTKNALIIKYINVNSTLSREISTNQPCYHGGLVGELGNSYKNSNKSATEYGEVYMEVSNISVNVVNPFAGNAGANKEIEKGFGGVVGNLNNNSVLKVTEKVTISMDSTISNGKLIYEGGGIVGFAHKGSVVELSGETDLSVLNFQLNNGDDKGIITGRQDSALIYAKGDGNGNGWTLKRPTTSVLQNKKYIPIDDIGNYGTVLRLADNNANIDSDFLGLDDTTHNLVIENKDTTSISDTITLSNAEDFIRLSITWQTRGNISGYSNINSDNWSSIKGKTIDLSGDIDLTGTGYFSITRDYQSDLSNDTYGGVFDGDSHTIILDAGTPYGFFGNEVAEGDGSGVLYVHNRVGIFAKASNNISNLEIAGSIIVSTTKDKYVGGYAAEVADNKKISCNNVTLSLSINTCSTGYASLKLGGLYGYVGQNTTIELSNTNIAAIIDNKSSCDNIYSGGAIGVSGNNNTITCDNVTLSAKITSNSTNYIKTGGIVAYMDNNNSTNSRVDINSINVVDQTITAPKANSASTECGGMLGYYWKNTDVTFTTPADMDKYALNIESGTINTDNIASVGGLVYRGSGKWTLNDRAINISIMSVSANKIGLLLCRGEAVEQTQDNYHNALYLEMTAPYESAYVIDSNKVTVSDNCSVFDEIVAYTAKDSSSITNNNENGVISIRTKDSLGVDITESTCNTYINRVEGPSTNSNSRYYYNLDELYNSAGVFNGTNIIDTPEKLLMWSVYKYAADNIKQHFDKNDLLNSINVIGQEDSNSKSSFDMKGLSYYPIDIAGVTVKNVHVKFYNKEIDDIEKNNFNKSPNAATQHYLLHHSLFNNIDGGDNTFNNIVFEGSIGLKLNGEGSGALYHGTAKGYKGNDNNPVKTNVTIRNISFRELSITGFENTTDYAPLLINSIGSYTDIKVMNIFISDGDFSGGAKVATSLIGNAGGSDATDIDLSFEDMKLPDSDADSIFTKATFLNKFQYKTNGGIGTAFYNFYKKDDWNDNGTYKHDVTYGREISDSKEYEGLQEWYYDKDTYGTEQGKVKNNNSEESKQYDFSGYLPYVYYLSDTGCHEIKVNQRASDLLEGCGTYGHPYVINDAITLNTIANYISTNIPRNGWKVQITNNQKELGGINNSEDIVYQYETNESAWVYVTKAEETDDEWIIHSETKLDNNVMHSYILSAYYDIKKTPETAEGTDSPVILTLNNFEGLGTERYPFRGVIVSTNGTTVELTGSDTSCGLIPYSYGSVVKNLNIKYSLCEEKDENSNNITVGKTLSYAGPAGDVNSSIEKIQYYPEVFFGGVIGCVLGGDNLIDNVNVTIADNWLTLGGDKKHLIEVGGYVGSVAGGGVIFRNIDENSELTSIGLSSNSIKDSTDNRPASLYYNRYIGRVINGYAFSEGCELTNTSGDNNNYKINKLDTSDTDCIKTNKVEPANSDDYSYKSTIKNSQGLLILSAIINSGAASGGHTYAYQSAQETYAAGTSEYSFGNRYYGKCRTATYDYVGKPSHESAQADFELSIKDDTYKITADSRVTNRVVPYLVDKYCTENTFVISGTTNNNYTENANSVVLSFVAGETYDMTQYDNGYQGIGARYTSAASKAGTSVLGSKYVKPVIKGIEGNNAVLKTSICVNEYDDDDDFKCAAVGGLVNLLRSNVNSTNVELNIDNLTIADSTIKMQIINSSMNKINVTDQSNQCLGVGGLFGATSASNNNWSYDTTIKINNVLVSGCEITGLVNAGGIFGSIGINYVSNNISWTIKVEKDGSPNNYRFDINNCSYNNCNITAQYMAGGFGGFVTYSGGTSIEDKSQYCNSISGDNNCSVAGADSEIIVPADDNVIRVAGGIIGGLSTSLNINYSGDGNDSSYADMEIKNISVSGAYAAGGVIGYSKGNLNINRVIVSKDSDSTKEIYAKKMAVGGLIGYIEESGKSVIVNSCTAKNLYIKKEDKAGALGGIIGYLKCSGDNYITVVSCNVFSSGVTNPLKIIATSDSHAGGVVGLLEGTQKLMIKSCYVSDIEISNSTDKKGYNGGLLGCMGNNTNSINEFLGVYDSEVHNITIYGQEAGGITSSVYGSVYGSNLLVDNVHIIVSTADKSAILIGGGDPDKFKQAYLAGVSIKGDSYFKLKDGATDYRKIVGNNTFPGTKSYISFADYTGTSLTNGENSLAGKGNELFDTEGKSPYVITSPKSTLKNVFPSSYAAKGGYVYADGASWISGSKKTIAETILDDIKSGKTPRDFIYEQTGVASFDFINNISSYNTYQTNKVSDADDFPVLVVTADNTAFINDYLNLITNGGYGQAVSMNTPVTKYVTAETKEFKYQDGKFIGNNNKPPLYAVSSSGNIAFKTTSGFDNDCDKFTMLTVTFKAAYDSQGSDYKIHIPVIVKRLLQVDFTATLGYGTHFNSDDYGDLKNHVLDSFGNPMTGYITYTYNSAYGKSVEYGWQNYINSSGDVNRVMEKNLSFSTGLPKGTCLTIVDCQDVNRKAYYYTVTEADANDKKTYSMSLFKDSDGNNFSSRSIGEIINVNVSQDDSGSFIEVDKDDSPTVCYNGKYYRLPKEGEDIADKVKYSVTVTEDQKKENYYLVITMPEGSSGAVNGWLGTSFEKVVPYNINYTLRNTDGSTDAGKDIHTDTASTYIISDGYKQTLVENLPDNTSSSSIISISNRALKVDIKDSITFPNDQSYNTKDQLYMSISGSLQTTFTNNNTGTNGSSSVTSRGSSGFPAGTMGTVKFYVYTEDSSGKRSYYVYQNNNGGTWVKYDSSNSSTNGDISDCPNVAASYTWTSSGANMELVLSTDGSIANAISMQGLRDKLKGELGGSLANTTTTFHVEAIMDAILPESGINVIPAGANTNGTPDNYAKLTYLSHLSTEKNSLSYSSTRCVLSETRVAYYRDAESGAVLSFDADKISQLGINLHDLDYNLDKDLKNAVIATTAVYDVSGIQGYADMLKDSYGIRFTMTLSEKSTVTGKTEEYKESFADPEKYMNIEVSSHNKTVIPEYSVGSGSTGQSGSAGTWSWIVAKDDYYDPSNDVLKTDGVFDGTSFRQSIILFVNVENVEAANHQYSNYKVELKAEVISKTGTGVDEVIEVVGNTMADDNIIYSLAKIKPEFITN